MIEPSASSPFEATAEPAASSGFLARLFLMPFWPPLWRSAASASTGEIVAPVLLLAVLLDTLVALTVAIGLGAQVRGLADGYDAQWDPIVWHDGQIDVEGTRLVRVDEGNTVLLVDPDGTVPLESLGDAEYIVVHRDEWIRQRAFGPVQRQPLAGFTDIVGPGPLRVDGTAIDAFWDEHGLTVQAVTIASLATIGSTIDVVGALVYALIASAMLFVLRERATPFAALFRVAFAASSASIVLGIVARAFQADLGCCGWVIWPTLLLAATAIAAPPQRR